MLGRAVRASGGERTSRAGDVAENPVIGERVVVRVGTEDPGGELLVAELFVRPGGAVAGEHVDPSIDEWFTVLEGRVGFRSDGRGSVAPLGNACTCRRGRRTTGGTRGERGAGHRRGQPHRQVRGGGLQHVLPGLGRQDEREGYAEPAAGGPLRPEFEDVLYFTSPPRPVQRALFAVLAPVARLLGYRGSYPRYTNRSPSERVEVEPWTGWDVRG
jgi:hypothetical protein